MEYGFGGRPRIRCQWWQHRSWMSADCRAKKNIVRSRKVIISGCVCTSTRSKCKYCGVGKRRGEDWRCQFILDDDAKWVKNWRLISEFKWRNLRESSPMPSSVSCTVISRGDWGEMKRLHGSGWGSMGKRKRRWQRRRRNNGLRAPRGLN
jgi:hypothetical protein